MPIGCLSILDVSYAYNFANDEIITYNGMTVCETLTIKTIDEIEVF